MLRALSRAALLLFLGVSACGDGVFVVSFNSGVIVGPPRCGAAGGQLDLRDQGGLVLVVIADDTDIFVAGRFGTCADLAADDEISVRGRRSGDEIFASSITVD